MASSTLAFIVELQGADYSSLASTNFEVGIVDPDGSGLTSSQINNLESSGKTLLAYLSIGLANNYRSYWQPSWNTSPPSFILGPNTSWPGAYFVEFWSPAWQQIVIDEAVALAEEGYDGVDLDVVDVYLFSNVAAADGGIANARADMVNFVEAISVATKAVNPDFKIVQNNALDLLTTNPDDPTSATNTSYLSYVDGVLAESTFYLPDNSQPSWTPYNLQYLAHAVAAGKTVFSLDYPSSTAAQQNFINQAVANGFVPFAAMPDLLLGGTIESVNFQIPDLLPSDWLSAFTTDMAATTLTLNGASTVTLGANASDAKITTVIAGNGDASITDSNSGTLTVNAAAMASTATLTLSSGSGTESFNVTGLDGFLTATNVEGALSVTTAAVSNLAIATAGGSAATNTLNASAMTLGQTLTLTGNRAATAAVGGNLSASAYTGALTVMATGTAAQTITTGGGADTITGGPSDTITGGAGNDTFVYTSGANSLYSAYDTITDFGVKGTDHFKIGHTVRWRNFHSLTQAASGNLYNDLAALLTTSNFAARGADLVTLTGSASDAGSYVIINHAGVAGFNGDVDAVIKLTAGAANVHASSFVA
jgi:cysteinyl-tRNA synthetase, unknown class